jgi:exosortase E/protease (VPEID-CTERM system)
VSSVSASGVGAVRARPASVAPHVWLALAGVLLLAEFAVLAASFDAIPRVADSHRWWVHILAHAGIVMPFATAVMTATVLLGGSRLRAELAASAALVPERRRWPWLVGHLAAFIVFFWLTDVVFGSPGGRSVSGWWAAVWALVGVTQAAALGAAALPPSVFLTVARRVLALLLGSAAVGAVAWSAGQITGEWWVPLSRSTLWLVSRLLPLVVPNSFVQPDALTIGTPAFSVTIAARCSGYEGIGLIWVFLGAYLWIFRTTLRFPHALLLLPLGTAVMWVANALRITGLVWIGSTFSPEVALGGFHANSGSLILCAVALGIVAMAQRSTFLARPAARPATVGVPTPVAAYVTPFLLVIASAMVSGLATRDGFDRFYALRVLAAGAALWAFRRQYAPWRWSWSSAAVGAGIAVAVPWILLTPASGTAPDATAAALVTMAPGWAALWIVCRLLGAVVTVPLAEELAFRGYLARRLIARDFERVPLERLSWLAVLGSALAFGMLHHRIVAGTLAGIVYGAVARRRGSLADAVVAHATTNALLAVWVLCTGNWSLW